MRLSSIDSDYWQLISAEARHLAAPETFWIPPLLERQSLKIGQAAKLIFEIESEDEEGKITRDCERMWVVISELVPPYFIGLLTNQPIGIDDDSAFYLKEGVEIPFLPEHVSNIDQPPEDFLKALFAESPKGVWPRA